ncbi:MAG: hypothetical protein DRI61_00125 [Chloroflexi bacterium]|nr:MAG: hypothetical protein DRI61_00125 [Chloroflexota bacterium]HDN79363.1 MBL fold metallo-hydrolase [Chloroflexota bacterium]
MKITFLGTGAAEGIPKFGCECEHCRIAREKDGKNVRQRTALLVEAAGHRILIDTPPEISIQLNKSNVFNLSAVFLTHEHFDHIGGLVEFEYWRYPIHIFAGIELLPKLRLTPRMQKNALLSPFLSNSSVYFGGLQIIPFRVMHHVPCYGFAFVEGEKWAIYLSDSSFQLSSFHFHLIRQADIAIFNTPTFDERDNHMSVRDVIKLVRDGSVKRAVLTHINHRNYIHEVLEKKVAPYGIVVAYDGMEIELG